MNPGATRRRFRRSLVPVLALAVAGSAPLAAGTARAQAVPGGGAGLPAAAPDTARLRFSPVDSLPAPLALHVLADTVDFGAAFAVAWDLPAGSSAAVGLPTPADPLLAAVGTASRPWWRPARRGPEEPQGRLAALPEAVGPRVVAWYRAYTTGPFRLEWAGRLTATVFVRGRVGDPSQVAAIRDPRAVPWLRPVALLLLPVLALVAALAWWWRRRRRPPGATDWPLPEPAWIAAAPALRLLLDERLLERGENRTFLDRLAEEARRFAAAHYGVPAADLTGNELAAACAARGHAAAPAGALARLLDDADLRRYDPQPPSAVACRERLVDFVACLADARVEPRQTPVDSRRRLAADQAWPDLLDVRKPVTASGNMEVGA